jgi:hypothetical protein
MRAYLVSCEGLQHYISYTSLQLSLRILLIEICLISGQFCDARSFIEWDPNDMPKDRQDGNKEDKRFAKLVEAVMGIARVGTKSDYACEEAYEKSTALRALIERIPVNVTRSIPLGNEGTDVNVDGNFMVATAALPMSQRKGCHPGRSNLQSELIGGAKCTSTYKRKCTVDG